MTKKFILIFFLITLTAIIFLLPLKFLLNFSNDDSFFYIKTACNFSNGSGSTFDLVNFTNGYHPLWFLLLSAWFFLFNKIFTFSPELFFRLVFIFDMLICTVTVFTLYHTLKLRNLKSAFGGIMLFLPLFLLLVVTRDVGTETHIVCLILALYLYVKSIELSSNKNFLFTKSLLLALLFLSRIDFFFTLIPAIIISDYFTTNTAIRKKYISSAIALTILTAVIYFLANKIYFGSFLNISSSIKNSFPEFVFFNNVPALLEPGYLTNHFAKTLFAVLVIFIFIYLYKFKKTGFGKFDFLLFGMCTGTICFILLNLAFNFHSIKEWYPAIPAFVCSLLLIRILNLFPKYYYFYLSLFYFIFVIYFYKARMENSKWDNVYDYALELKDKTETEDRIFQIDLCGITGFFSERSVINGDGLANSFEYFEHLKNKNLKLYFAEKEINYYSTHSVDNSTYEMKDSSGHYIDLHYSYSFGGYPFTFSKENLVLKYPFYYEHAVNKYRGSWYLFRIENSNF